MPALSCPQATHDSLSRWAIGAYSISDIAQQKANEAALAITEFFVAAFDRIEPVTVAGKQLFRAQIMGLTEAETRKACEIMERAPHPVPNRRTRICWAREPRPIWLNKGGLE